ncbi:MAG: 4-hydroxybenzoate octaprenyltransferase [Hyphomonas sp.]|nr:4-hydroxybenzoate octaprenyltransferase [Hyphomonas sp.]MBU3919558.1 4-hydroxybenzoate octaprenyltransferase [Alphaproteobacteria bacterium]MBU4061745.1 4-hydroxybenzoate octaprenyltransferase [Alphaproteobacteria bacterium]MBU4164553.1 4-hydroxybenzoate octaprenyltransferase [Alphaproteobacteria bacterium]MBU4568685.1 4-hydroxybenzoate octaprenyltransferase [Alphaproteobacteria bacterium]
MTVPPRHDDSGSFCFPADSALTGWLGSLPAAWRPYAMLARLDRPVGIWLLYLPCLIGLAFQRLSGGLFLADLGWAVLFFIGAATMRGAGCTWNDITDRDFDAKVARTALRPIPSGAVSVKQAYLFLLAQLGVSFVVWVLLPGDAKLTALLSLPLVAVYPYAKRVTWWPQAWLGLTFNWGVLVGAATASLITGPVYVLYFGLALWTVAYDTIYALQDREDDALIGVRSTARLFGKRAVLISFCFHIGAATLIALAAMLNDAGRIGALAALGFLLHGLWQTMTLKTGGEAAALRVFKSNVWAGGIVALGFLIAALVPEPAPKTIFAGQELVPPVKAESMALPFGLEIRRKPEPKPDVWLARDIRRAMEIRGLDPDATEPPPER